MWTIKVILFKLDCRSKEITRREFINYEDKGQIADNESKEKRWTGDRTNNFGILLFNIGIPFVLGIYFRISLINCLSNEYSAVAWVFFIFSCLFFLFNNLRFYWSESKEIDVNSPPCCFSILWNWFPFCHSVSNFKTNVLSLIQVNCVIIFFLFLLELFVFILELNTIKGLRKLLIRFL